MDKPLHPMYRQLEQWLPKGGRALELGAGVGHGAVFLQGKGFHVTAIDAEPEAVAILRSRLSDAEIIESRFEDIQLAEGLYDVAVAGFSLFFLNQQEMAEFWPRLVSSIRVGGIFTGEFLGLHDDWVSEGYLGQSEVEVHQCLKDFEILYWEEAERDGKTSQGTDKHWHVYHVIARRVT